MILDIESGEVLQRFINTPDSEIAEINISPDGSKIVHILAKTGEAQLWDIQKNKRLKTFKYDSIYIGKAKFTPDNSKVIFALDSNPNQHVFDAKYKEVVVYDIMDDKEFKIQIDEEFENINIDINFGYTNSVVILTHYDYYEAHKTAYIDNALIQIWDLTDEKLLKSFQIKDLSIFYKITTFDNKLLITQDNMMIYDIDSGKLLNKIELNFSPKSIKIYQDKIVILEDNNYDGYYIINLEDIFSLNNKSFIEDKVDILQKQLGVHIDGLTLKY